MATLYDGNGNPIQVSGGASSSDFGVTEYDLFTNDNGESSREAVLTYQGKKLYPKNFPEQRLDYVKDYDGGVMFALGDSYTAMGGSYFSAFAEKHGLVCDNRGVGSSTIAGSADGVTVGYKAFWTRLDEAITQYQAGHTIDGVTYHPEDVKLITFMGGANDWWTVNDEIDRIGNPQSEDKEQLYGACKYIFHTLLSTFTNADIVVILQPNNGTAAWYGLWMKENVVREMAEWYGLPICDCCFEWYSPSNPIDHAKYWQADNVHMTDAGNTAIFDKLEKVVNNLPFARN